MKFVPRYAELEAEQLTESNIPPGVWPDKTVRTSHGDKIPVQNGMWIAAEPDGTGHYPIKDEIFKKRWVEKGENSFIRRLFDWKSMEACEDFVQFEDCTLRVPLGGYLAGTELIAISLHWLTGELKLWDTDNKCETIQLELMWSPITK